MRLPTARGVNARNACARIVHALRIARRALADSRREERNTLARRSVLPEVRDWKTASMKEGAFISYRWDRGSHLSRLLKYALERLGLDVFLDVDDLGTGQFDDDLVREIERREHFIVVLTKGSLHRCRDDADYFRREIETAIASKRKIVPTRECSTRLHRRTGLP